MRKISVLFLLLCMTLYTSAQKTIYLEELDVIHKGTVGWGTMKNNKSIDGNPLKLKGVTYQHGIGTHAEGRIDIELNKNATRFTCVLGIDDEVNVVGKPKEGIVSYEIINYSNSEEKIVKSGTIKRIDSNPIEIDLDVTGWEYLCLVYKEGNGNNWSDHVDFCDAIITYNNDSEAPIAITYEEMIAKNNISFMCTFKHYSLPNVKMMHRFKHNNESDVLTVSDLPEGLKYNAERELVEGKITEEGTYKYNVTLTRGNKEVTKEVTVEVSSDLISPTPLMAWMSWNIFQNDINEQVLKEVADLMVSTGLKDIGFNYLLVDDVWHGQYRLSNGKPTYNTVKFPSGLKALTEYIHSKGLKAGIYSDAATQTCAKEFGSYGYEEIDAQQYADWGFDFLKYDYCFAPSEMQEAKKRYKKMGDALKATGREFYYYVCEWGVLKPWLWASEAGGQSWRVSYDSRDIWDHGKYGVENYGAIQGIDIMKPLACYAGPNQFNDADMLCAGLYGQGGEASSHNGANGMTDTEYQSQFSMWTIFAAPLIISFDLKKMNDATERILTNKEVIAINQDPMGQQGECVYSKNGKEVYMKDLENGDVAVALLNRGSSTTNIEIDLDKLFLREKEYIVRDLWKQEDIGTVTEKISASVESHETKLYRIRSKNSSAIYDIQNDNYSVLLSQNNKSLNVNTKGFDKNKKVKIISMSGNVVKFINANTKTFTIDTSELTTGIYILNVSDGKINKNKKFRIK